MKYQKDKNLLLGPKLWNFQIFNCHMAAVPVKGLKWSGINLFDPNARLIQEKTDCRVFSFSTVIYFKENLLH